MDGRNDNRINAEIAYSNRNLNEALLWYQKVLQDEPDDIYVLSRAGTICVPLGLFDQALEYFGRAKELDPKNGDNFFNYANACFFNKDYVGAFESYVEAEKIGCSSDVMPRLYYQLAMICSMRQDVNAALLYFQKCQDIDKEGMFSISPEFISEKLKIYMFIQDYENAGKCAALLVASDPTQFKSYMIYYSMLMAKKDLKAAEKVLDDAVRYSHANEAEKNSILLQYAALYMAMGEKDSSHATDYSDKAVKLLEEKINDGSLNNNELVTFTITLAEVLMKANKFDAAIRLLQGIIDGSYLRKDQSGEAQLKVEIGELSQEEIEEMLQADLELVQEMVYSGELDENLGQYAEVEYDDEWNPVHQYDENAFASLEKAQGMQGKGKSVEDKKKEDYESENAISRDAREKIYFMLLSCYLEKDNYSAAEKYAIYLNASENKYYGYYGKYVCALVTRKQKKDAEVITKKYQETLAFFRSRAFADPSDNLATIFRARMYAEDGKYEKALELSKLLGEDDCKAIEKYVSECRK